MIYSAEVLVYLAKPYPPMSCNAKKLFFNFFQPHLESLLGPYRKKYGHYSLQIK